ncbi:MAG: hypothetical protein CM15mP55_3190 [Hyphomicrobiales bacterium]|nr:MAG: hypothetical protein CM15mP55_3190 [Hyphomicrobiales bacterium]
MRVVPHDRRQSQNRVGPHLNNIIGREIAVLEDYRYSKP